MVKSLTEWAESALKDIWLFSDQVEIKNAKGIVITRDVKKERELAIGLINANNAKELYDIARQVCPVGTIIEEYDEDFWTKLYSDKSKVINVHLTKALIDERLMKSAKYLLEVLSKRSKNWKDDTQGKGIEVKANEGTHITFTIE